MKFSNWLRSLRASGQRIRKSGRRVVRERQQLKSMEALEPRLLLTFQGVAASFDPPFDPESLDLADLDGDGDLDAFISSSPSSSLGQDGSESVWFNDGQGNFTDSGQRLGSDQTGLAAVSGAGAELGDFDRDGDVDAFVSSLGGPDRLYVNDGNGAFSVGASIATLETYAMVSGDVDADGDLDVIVETGTRWTNTRREVWLNDGTAGFSLASRVDGGYFSTSFDLGDVDGDGDLDLLDGRYSSDRIWLNDGVGGFTDSGQEFRLTDPSNTVDSPYTLDVEFGDFDNDGDLDFVAGKHDAGDHVYFNDGTGPFTDSGQLLEGLPGRNVYSNRTRDLTVADMDGDGDLDILAAMEQSPGTVWLNEGDGQFTSQVALASPFGIAEDHQNWRIATGDLDGDHDLDAIILRRSTDHFDIVYFNQGFTPPNSAPVAVDDAYSTDEDTTVSPTGTAAYASAVLADNPLGYWRLGEASGSTAIDSSGRGNDGTFNGAVTLGTGGAIADGDTSISLTNTAGYVDAGNPAELDISDDTLTIEAWVNPSAVATMPIAGKTQSGRNDYTLWLVSSGGRNVAHFNLYNGSGEANFNGTIDVPVDEWTHITGTYDGTTASIYVNGVLDRTRSFSGNISGNDALNFEIGRRTNSGHQFRGQIDEVALYGDALSADRVLAHFEAADEAGGTGGSVLENDTDADSDALTVSALNGDSGSIGQATVLASGATVTLNADGTFQYDPTTSAIFNALTDGESTTDSFEYTVDDGNGGTDSATVSITVNGVNDAASISGDIAGAMTEDEADVTGSLTVIDVDNENTFQVQPDTAYISPDGASGSPIQGSAAALIDGDTGLTSPGNSVGGFNTDDSPLTFTFGSPKTLDEIVIYNGWNSPDQAIAQFDLTFFDSLGTQIGSTQTVNVPGVHGATESASFAAVSNVSSIVMSNQAGVGSTWEFREVEFSRVSETVGNYGAFSIDADGNWSYTRTADLQSLAVGEVVSDSFSVQSTDGTASQVVTVTITGENDAPIVANTGNVSASEGQTATNSGVWSDVDASDVVTLTASVGTVTQNVDGTWNWSFDTNDGPEDSRTVTITATDDDGAETQSSFDLTVNNVAPALKVRPTLSVDEGDTATTSGTWSDSGDDTVTLSASVGNIVQNADGTFTWSFDTSDGPEDSQTVTITATDSDGAATVRNINLTVNNVAPSLTVDASTVTVDEGQTATMSGTWSDPGNDVVTVAASVGTVTTNADGTWDWSYFAADGRDKIRVTLTATDGDSATSSGAGGAAAMAPATKTATGAATASKPAKSGGGAASTTGSSSSAEFVLIINNVAPSVASAGDVAVDEGATATNSGTWGDPGDDVVTLAASVGTVTQNVDGTWNWSFDTNDGPEDSRTVTITATDDDGAETQSSFDLTVVNVAPSLKVKPSLSVDEGDTATTSGTWSDSGDDTVTLSASVGSIVQNADGTFTWSFDTSDGPADSQTVTITATDSDGASSDVSFPITVNNVAPSVASDNSVIEVDEGQTATNSGNWSDPGADVVTVSASVGAVTTNADGTWNWSYDTVDGREKINVVLTAVDSDGATRQSSFVTIVQNVAPTVTSNGNVTVDEGATATNSGTWSDPGDDVVVVSASIGTVTQNADGTWSWNFDTTDGPDDSQTVTVTASDDDGGETQTSFELCVNNVAPTIASVSSTNADVENASGDGTVSVSGSFSDPGLDTHTVTVNWGDGTSEDVSVDQSADSFMGEHNYASGGIFTITVTVTDSDGAVSNTETTSAVVKGAGLVNGTLFVIGTDGKDVIHVHEHWRRDRITVHAHLDIQHRGRWHRHATSTHVYETYAAADVDQIVVHALAGNDHVHVGGYFFGNTAKDAVIFGGDGNDHIVSSQGNDTIDGGAGSDFISSRGGNDVIVDLTGDNYVHAGDGDDVVTTGNGNDCIHGGSGDDQINAGDGHNWASGGSGNDIIIAGIGNDRLNGDLNNDLIVGGGGNDRIDGGRGRDVLIGGTGSDRVNGGNSGDLLIGGSAENASDMASLDAALSAWADGDLSAALLNLGTISDDAARDILKGGRGTDELIGGAGDKVRS